MYMYLQPATIPKQIKTLPATSSPTPFSKLWGSGSAALENFTPPTIISTVPDNRILIS